MHEAPRSTDSTVSFLKLLLNSLKAPWVRDIALLFLSSFPIMVPVVCSDTEGSFFLKKQEGCQTNYVNNDSWSLGLGFKSCRVLTNTGKIPDLF